MNHSNMYAVGLALCTFANISSEEMSRDLSNEIEKLLGSSNSYIRKKVRPLLQSNAWWAIWTGYSYCRPRCAHSESSGACPT